MIPEYTKIFVELLSHFGHVVSGRGCTDYDIEDTPVNRRLLEKMEAWNVHCTVEEWKKHPEFHEPKSYKGRLMVQDYFLLGYLKHLLEKELQPENACHDEEGKFKWFDETLALSQLLADDVLFCNTRDYSFSWGGHTDGGHTIVLFANCNDVFAWGCADAEDVGEKDLEDLYRLWYANKKWGAMKWVCMKRNERPQIPIEEDMKKEGVWDEKMEALPENYYWKKLKEEKVKKDNKNE